MAFDQHTNFAYSTVATAPSPATSGTSLHVQAGDGALFPAVPFNATVWPAGVQPTHDVAEIVRVTVRSTDTLTITRAQESSSARSIAIGDQIAATITKKTFTDVENAVALLNTVAASGASQTIDFATGNTWDITLNANCTFTLASVTSGVPTSLTLLLRQDGTGGRTVTWPGSVTWLGGVAPVLHSGASTFDFITLITVDGGTTWYGAQAVSPAPSFARAWVFTDESTATTTYTDLTTLGPQVAVTVGASGMLLTGYNCQHGGTSGFMAPALSGGNTVAASDDWAWRSNLGGTIGGRTYVFTGLTPGSTTVTAKYRASSGTMDFLRRELWAMAV